MKESKLQFLRLDSWSDESRTGGVGKGSSLMESESISTSSALGRSLESLEPRVVGFSGRKCLAFFSSEGLKIKVSLL